MKTLLSKIHIFQIKNSKLKLIAVGSSIYHLGNFTSVLNLWGKK